MNLRPHGITAEMYDAVPEGVPFIPNDAAIVAGYGDGLYQSLPLLIRRFGGRAHITSIGVWIGHLFEWTDVEPGNPINTPTLVRADFEHRKAHGVWEPGYYGTMDAIRNTILPGLAGIPREEYRIWLADWDGNESFIPIPGGVECAKQFRSETHYDVSVVNVLAFLGPDLRSHHHRLAGNIGRNPRHEPSPGSSRHEITRRGRSLRRPGRIRRTAHKLAHVHPKAAGGVGGGGLGAGIVAILVGSGVHITPTEAAGISTLTAFALAWLVPSSPVDTASLLTDLEGS